MVHPRKLLYMFIVDCCKDANHITVARKNSLRILSSGLKERCCMALLFQLCPDSDSEGTGIEGSRLLLVSEVVPIAIGRSGAQDYLV